MRTPARRTPPMNGTYGRLQQGHLTPGIIKRLICSAMVAGGGDQFAMGCLSGGPGGAGAVEYAAV